VEQPTDNNFLPDLLYDFYSGVNLFDEGIHVISTSKNPLTHLENSHFPESYWILMRENVTSQATDEDFISILISRGNKPTGGYNLNVVSFDWLESYPVKLRFHVNFTDPGADVIVSQALTNPMVLVPIGKLYPGEYEIEIHIVQYIQTFDEYGNIKWTPVMTLKEEVWKQDLRITSSQGSVPAATFSRLIGSPSSDTSVAKNSNTWPEFGLVAITLQAVSLRSSVLLGFSASKTIDKYFPVPPASPETKNILEVILKVKTKIKTVVIINFLNNF